jgi:heavy metal sensor kinase
MPFPVLTPPKGFAEAAADKAARSRLGLLKTGLGTLRFRLTVWNTVVVLGASLAALVALREGARYTLQNETDVLLREETLELSLAVQQLQPDLDAIHAEFERKADGHAQHGWFVQLLSADGIPAWQSPNSPAAVHGKSALNDSPFALFTHDGFRVAQRRVEGSSMEFQVRIGIPTANTDAEVNRLMRPMFPIAIALSIVAPLGGYLLARRATTPVRQIIETTRRLRPSRLRERLPIRGAGDELDQLSSEINSFLDQIAGYLERHREFIGNAAHELRSPLTAIQTSVDLALSKDRSREEYQELLFTLSDECESLRVLVNQLLTLAENDAVGLERPTAPARWDELVRQSLDVFTAVAEDREIDLIWDVQKEVTIPGDAARLRQIINNLIDNALKFTPPGGRVTVKLQQNFADHQAVLTVEDTGLGIPADELPRVFDRFYQVDKSHQRDSRHGNGLGLSIVQSIVQLHGGALEVASEPGKGSLFRVKLPLGGDD